MSAYARLNLGDYGSKVKPYRAPTPIKPFAYKLPGGAKVKACYDQCHLAWRAGLIDSWYYGRRSPSDPTIVWELNGHELAMEEVLEGLARRRKGHDVASIEWGETWVGYRSVIVTSTSGETIREHYDPVVAGVCYETAENVA